MYDWTTAGALALASLVVLYIGRRASGSRRSHPFPPGPRGLPWVGNVGGIDTNAPWVTYAEWARTYGDLVYFRLLGKDMIIINSEKVAKDLLENRSKNYSDRPHFITNELCGVDFSSVFLPYGERWRQHRRMFHQTFRLEAVSRFFPYQHRKACQLLQRLLNNPEQLDDHVFEYTAAVIMNCTYDYDPLSRKDKLVSLMANTLDIVTPLLRPDIAVLVSAFPWVLHLPSWLPGMSFKRQMAIAFEYSKEYLERPLEYALQKGSSHGASSMVHDALRDMDEKGVSPTSSQMDDIKKASGTSFLAASETSNAVLMTFFLMMVMHPEAQEKAQVQIDALLGNARLPTLDDRPFLPYVDAILRETLRYNPVAPLAVPHVSVNEDVYDGYFIPKGAFLIPNAWAMAHDETRYPDPHAFIPERFLNDDGSLKPNDIEHIAFGFGRRICVGRHFADTSVWSVMAKVLAVFKISKPLDKNGVEVPIEARFSSGIVIRPLPFEYRIKPRFPEMDADKLEEFIAVSHA